MSSSIKGDFPSARSSSLDALRGFAILTMVLSGVIPYGVLPAWMYHAQLPPPAHKFDPNLPGLTWVDLVFPLFLFALGAAIPLALSKRIEGQRYPKAIGYYILERGFLLGFFAIFLRHVRPHVLNPDPQTKEWIIALTGFMVMFGIFTQLPRSWEKNLRWSIKIMSWIAAVTLLYLLKYPDGSGFSLYRSDIIIMVLANVAVFGALIWTCTRNNHLLRIGTLGILLALRLSSQSAGWLSVIWNYSPLPWIFKWHYLQYLFIVIPGTVIGDFFLLWMKKPNSIEPVADRWSNSRLLILVVITASLIMTCLIGLQWRWIWQTLVVCSCLAIISLIEVKNPLDKSEELLQKLVHWGIYFLLTGLLLEPFEGGIKKDHSTVSYYLVTTGLSIFILSIFLILGDIMKKRNWLSLLAENGQNPMIAYVGIANFIWPIFTFLSLDRLLIRLTPTPWLGFLRGVFYTLLLAVLVKFLTRRKIFWKT